MAPRSLHTPLELRKQARRNLGSVVITIELTLISVLAGVILGPLIESATPLVRDLRYEFWPYVLSSLLLILWFWTEVISHSLTFISWPIDIGHYLLYIVGALLASIQMHLLTNPQAWFGMFVFESAGAVLIFAYDLKLMRAELAAASGAEAGLLTLALARQQGGLRVAWASIIAAAVAAGLLLLFPGLFIDRHAHVILALVFVGWMGFMLLREIHTFHGLRQAILAKAAEELVAEEA